MNIIAGAGQYAVPAGTLAGHWAEQFRVPDLSAGTYSIPAGGTDDQEPHTEDEIYVVMAGAATLTAGGEQALVGPGAVIYVPAGQEHRFSDVTADLALLVLFAPAEYSKG